MKLRQLLAARGIHYFVTRFGWQKLRGMAFDEKYRRGDWNFRAESTGELAAVIRRYLRAGDLLIMGCGQAAILDGLEAAGLKSALGIDLSPEAIRLAGHFASEKISFQLADMVAFQCPRPYDVILFSESLNYVPLAGQEQFLRRLGKSLKPGGVFVVTIAQAKRYADILEGVRRHFNILEDRPFSGSNRHLLVFDSHDSRA
jgi:2-polyprenyl-3-methyl-5-hydroxy-6-metoxy-1,4-benzoquinol methylase